MPQALQSGECSMIGFCMTGSFCCFEKSIAVLEKLLEKHDVLPIMSYNAASFDTKFGKAEDFRNKVEKLCGKKIIQTIPDAEPIGPAIQLDCLVVCPCTGNTMSKVACGICDTPATMAIKAQLRNERPVLIALATNDGLSGSSASISKLLMRKNIFFVPFSQDSPFKKPRSLVCEFDKTEEALKYALLGKQLQPILAT
ncbi:MAG: dipicolinate synthase subunit B [Clostridia bacterium]|nr:dipicolinate synthase subunit B [Clostridia bacterium]